MSKQFEYRLDEEFRKAKEQQQTQTQELGQCKACGAVPIPHNCPNNKYGVKNVSRVS